jgi:hypothetical protein
MTQPQQSNPEGPETQTGRKPFQFGLGSLFVVTTISAVLLGVAKMYPRWGISSLIAYVVFLPAFFVGRSLLKDGQRVSGLGCMAGVLTVLIPGIAISVIFNDPEGGEMGQAGGSLCLLTAFGLITATIWLVAFSLTMAAREAPLRQAEHDRGDAPPEDEADE